jgi:hypothetical protein
MGMLRWIGDAEVRIFDDTENVPEGILHSGNANPTPYVLKLMVRLRAEFKQPCQGAAGVVYAPVSDRATPLGSKRPVWIQT